jgi:hypothetical protein
MDRRPPRLSIPTPAKHHPESRQKAKGPLRAKGAFCFKAPTSQLADFYSAAPAGNCSAVDTRVRKFELVSRNSARLRRARTCDTQGAQFQERERSSAPIHSPRVCALPSGVCRRSLIWLDVAFRAWGIFTVPHRTSTKLLVPVIASAKLNAIILGYRSD